MGEARAQADRPLGAESLIYETGTVTAATSGPAGSEGQWLRAELVAEQVMRAGARGFSITPSTPGAPVRYRQPGDRSGPFRAVLRTETAHARGTMPGTRALATVLVPAGTAPGPSRC